MLKVLFLLFAVASVLGCPREPSPYHSRVGKTQGDNGFQIKVNENPEKYVPGQIYTMYLMGSRTFDKIQHFRRFTINVESTEEPGNLSPQKVGTFQLFGDSLSKFNEDCVNTISETSDLEKTEAFFMWKAPPPGSGCVTFRAMVLEDATHWFADDGALSKTFCEKSDSDVKFDPEDCCACDEAKYSMIFEGIWSNITHPKDFPFSLWLTHFSDVIGASHERNFTFWGEGQISSEGFRSLAEWGSVRLMESELRAKGKFLRTIIKAAGLWYPNVNTNTSANFKVDRRHHLVSLASMFGTTWCQELVWLVLNDLDYEGAKIHLEIRSPFFEVECLIKIMRNVNKEIPDFHNIKHLNDQPSRRCIKTHLPWNLLPRQIINGSKTPKIIHVMRNPRQVGPSYFHHLTEMFPLYKLGINDFIDLYIKGEGPSPDWVVGVNGLNLCLKSCQWVEDMTIDLYPYDAGTDSGITYMSPNSETKPRERMYRITTTYPEDPRAPFYDITKKEMNPMARLYLKREKVIPKSCDEKFLFAQLDVSENTEDTTRPECAVTEYSSWSDCSVTCGKGLRMRTREYRMPQKAQMFGCNRQLVSKEMCVAAVAECESGPDTQESEEQNLEVNDGLCATTAWTLWSDCSSTCGVGMKTRSRQFIDRMGRKKCPHVTTMEKEKCMEPPCTPDQIEVADPMCPVTEWSDFSPCSASCGKGVRFRTRLLLVEPGLQEKCSSRVELMQQRPCMDTPDCTFDMATAKQVCMEESIQGPCTGFFQRYYFESSKMMCVPFVYGGCRGNRNNFLTLDECNQACQVVRDALIGGPGISRQAVPTAIVPPQVSTHDAHAAKIDCMVTEWTQWTPCSVSCGIGYKYKQRMIKRPAENGGRSCPQQLTKRRRCLAPAC